MQYREIGSSGVRVSVIGFGGWVLGTSWYGTLSEADAGTLVHRALELGITLFDTANSYGEGGISEVLLAGALAGGPPDRYVLRTKVAYAIHPPPHHPHSDRPPP